MRTVHLYGHLAEQFGSRLTLEVNTPAEALRCLCVNFKRPFMDAIKDGHYRVVRGETLDLGHDTSPDMFRLGLGKSDLHILPVPEGAKGGKGKGMFMIVLGAVLLATGVGAAAVAADAAAETALAGDALAEATVLAGTETAATATGIGLSAGFATSAGFTAGLLTYGQVAMYGAGLMLSGIASMMSPTPKVADTGAPPDQRASFIFNGAVNTGEQGTVIPIPYGEVMVGSVVVSSGVDTERINV